MISPDEGFHDDEITRFPDGLNLARLLPTVSRKPFIVGIDGRSGAGKTTLSDQLAAVLRRSRDVVVFRLEDVYPGWSGLSEGMGMYYSQVLEPLRRGQDAHWTAWDWLTSEPGTPRLTRPAEIVLVEGVGACHREARTLLDTSVWVELPTAQRRQRALERDGGAYESHWEQWAAQEEEYLAADPVWECADIIHPGPSAEPAVEQRETP
ncbi:uridine kinase family protein [Kocuria tytonis]|uniref:Para-aminobenzoate synthase, component I n=1 Tax=Kocuria tytonis TaxID=2054280 RepID=A0A495A4Z9_9MICC|nr:hypothetical protein [Kocuria tytonis]RKQ34838.1 hypothetical protein C1C97_005970 [Kocuria tytonis]